jgi:ribonuclease VapC
MSRRFTLGDRCCLALAEKLGLPVLTIERSWERLAGAVHAEIRLLR